VPTLIRPVADAGAGEASHITIQTFNDSEALTALRNGSDNLELIGWHTPPGGSGITRAADSASQAGTAQEVSLALMGRRAITAVRSGSGKLLLISWEVPPGLGAITRLWDSGTAAGDASAIAISPVGADLLITAVRAGDGHLLLISWRLEPDGTLSRLHDSGSQAGGVTVVTIAAVDGANVITAVRNLSGNLELIGWTIGANGTITRWSGSAAEAGAVSAIAITAAPSGEPVNDIVTAVQNGSGDLLLIAWRPSPVDGTIARLADSSGEAGQAGDLSIVSATTSAGTPVLLVSMRNGSGLLEIIAFRLIADDNGALILRTGDYTGPDSIDVTGTAIATAGGGRLVSANRANNDLAVATYLIAPGVTTLIRPIATASAGDAAAIDVQAFNASDVLTAFQDGSGDLQLIGWRAPAQDFAITRAAEAHAGAVGEVALALMGRRAVTAVRNGAGNLLLISWDAPPGLTAITRLQEIGAGAATNITIAAVTDTVLVTALRNGAGNLLLISWRLDPSTGSFARLHEASAGAVSIVRLIALDTANVLTAVRNGSDNLELIGWSVDANGTIDRWGDSGSQAGEVQAIAMTRVSGTALSSDVVTAVRDGSDNLLLIAWRVTPSGGGIERLADSGGEAGTASLLAVTTTVTPTGTTTILVSLQRGSGNLGVIAFELLADDEGEPVIVRTGDFATAANTVVFETALTSLEPGRILSACRMNGLALTTYQVADAATMPAPKEILDLKFDNPDLSITNDPDWSTSHGTFPTGTPMEWVQVLAPKDEYEHSTLVGGSGWVIGPEYSGADVPFTHPFGFDWEFQVALDDQHARLISRANAVHEEGDSTHLAAELGVPVTRGLLGVEWDTGLLAQSFRAQVNHGDRVALAGRWILDEGHDFDNRYRTEIHPPLIVAAASVHRDRRGGPFTRAVFMARPFLPGQTFTVDVDDAYHDASPDDGALLDHLVHEVEKVVTLRSRRVEAHPKIKSMPFRGRHELHAIVRPPARPAGGPFELAVSFQFTMRAGCTVSVSPFDKDAIDVAIRFDEAQYVAPHLPARHERDYFPAELDQLSSGAGFDIVAADDITTIVSAILGGVPLGLYVQYVLGRGIRTDEYSPLAEININDSSQAAINVPVTAIPAGEGLVVDNVQPYPMFGWLETRWVPTMTPKKPSLTTANVNRWLKTTLADPARARQLKQNWVEVLLDEFTTTKEQVESLALIPAEYAKDLQTAVGRVVDHGGTIVVERESEDSPGTLVVTPKNADPKAVELSVGIYHCTFNAHCRHWKCGWGPAKK